MTTAERLRGLRDYLGLDIPEAAERAGMSPEALLAIEDAERGPSEAELGAIARAYEHPAASLNGERPPAVGPFRGLARLTADLDERDAAEIERFIAYLHDSTDEG